MLAVMSAAFGFAVNAHTNLVTNYFKDVLHLSGPQFGYITAIREIGGFVLIFLTALFYRISLQKLTAGALVVLAVGYALFSLAPTASGPSFPGCSSPASACTRCSRPRRALGMSLTTAARSGSILGRHRSDGQGGTMAALVMIILIFKFDWLSYGPTFVILGGACSHRRSGHRAFPHLHEGQPRKTAPKREPHQSGAATTASTTGCACWTERGSRSSSRSGSGCWSTASTSGCRRSPWSCWP